METVGLVLQMVSALAFVLALMWVAARVVKNVGGNRGTGVIELLARQSVGRTSSVAVLRVADRAIIVGVTENQVSLLTETDLDIMEAAVEEAEAKRLASRTPLSGIGASKSGASALGTPSGPLAGSILSPTTWRRSLEAIRDRTARRG